MSDPRVRGPRDLPDLRLLLLERWRPDGPFWRAAEWDAVARRHPQVGQVAPALDGKALAHAGLWWVTAEMTHRVAGAAATLPATTLNDDLVPEPFGFVVFAEPLIGTDAVEHDQPVVVHAILWGRMGVLPGGRCVLITHDDGLDDGELARLGGRKAITMSAYQYRTGGAAGWIPLGGSQWLWGEETAEVHDIGPVSFDGRQQASMQEDRRWLATLWLLAAQPLVASVERTAAGRPAVRRSARAKVSADVRLVDVRRALAPAAAADEGGGGRRVEWSRRWIVGGDTGFWRQQACGPGWSEHRPVWIAPFVKGPADKPLVVPERVNVVRDDR